MQQQFLCPRCNASVTYGIPYCQHCGCQLHWQQQTPAQMTPPVQQQYWNQQSPPTQVQQQYSNEQQTAGLTESIYRSQYTRKKKTKLAAYLLWFLFGLHYAYLGKWGMQFIFWVTIGGVLFWWLIDLFRIPGLVRDYNEDQTIDAMWKAKVINSWQDR